MGIIFTMTVNYITKLGSSVIILKQAQKSCAALFVTSEQGLQEILQLKYLAMEEANRSQQNITAQKYIDQLNIDSIKKSIMRNYIVNFPKSYSNIIEYSNWEEMEDYVDRVTKEENGKEIL